MGAKEEATSLKGRLGEEKMVLRGQRCFVKLLGGMEGHFQVRMIVK